MRHIVFFQHGDFGQAWRRFAQGEGETYRDQRRSVDFVAGLAPKDRVTIVAVCEREHREVLAPGLVSVGITMKSAFRPWRLLRLMAGLGPDLLVCRTPHPVLLSWAGMRALPCLPIFADTFALPRGKGRLGILLLRKALKSASMPCVGNHSRNASLSVEAVLQVPAERIVPWDRPPLQVNPDPKTAGKAKDRFQGFYAGALAEPKGLGDLITAVGLLRDQGLWLGLDVGGGGDTAPWEAMVAGQGLGDRIRFLGRLANTEVRSLMRQSDVVFVPTRHDYAEGLPNTMCEALAERTALIVSDHPSFAGRLQAERDCLMFRGGDPEDLARQVARLMGDGALQDRLSQNGAAAHDALYIGLEWFRLVAHFIEDPVNATGWVARHNLTELRRTGRIRPEGETP